MKITVTKKVEVDIKFLQVCAKVRYWEDAEINGEPDVEGELTPCRNRDNWEPVIDVETGQITNWEPGKKASLHFKVCDAGNYLLRGADGVTHLQRSGYVPDCMSPGGKGYGDYIIMEVDENGFIENWEADFEDFNEEED